MGAVGQAKATEESNAPDEQFDGDEVDDDLVFSTVPQRSLNSAAAQIHFDEIDDEEMRRFAESFEQEQQQDVNMDDDQLCEEDANKMPTPTKSLHTDSKKRKEPCIEDLDALLNDDDEDDDDEDNEEECHVHENDMDQHQMSPVFKKKP